MATPTYLMWYDGNPKISINTKIEDAIAAYERRFKIVPNVVLVSETENTALEQQAKGKQQHKVHIRSATFVRRNNFLVGLDKEVESGAAQATLQL